MRNIPHKILDEISSEISDISLEFNGKMLFRVNTDDDFFRDFFSVVEANIDNCCVLFLDDKEHINALTTVKNGVNIFVFFLGNWSILQHNLNLFMYHQDFIYRIKDGYDCLICDELLNDGSDFLTNLKPRFKIKDNRIKFLELGGVPKDFSSPNRYYLLKQLFKISNNFLLFHEIAHHTLGHFAGETSTKYNFASGNIERKKEIEADFHAVKKFFNDFNVLLAEFRKIDENITGIQTYSLIVSAISVSILALQHQNSTTNSTYLPKPIRLSNIIIVLAINFFDILYDEILTIAKDIPTTDKEITFAEYLRYDKSEYSVFYKFSSFTSDLIKNCYNIYCDINQISRKAFFDDLKETISNFPFNDYL